MSTGRYRALSDFFNDLVKEGVNPEQTRSFLAMASEYRGQRNLFDTIQEGFGEVIEGVARGTVRVVDGGGEGFSFLKLVDITDDTGFMIKELDESYRRWVKSQKDRFKQLTPAQKAEFGPPKVTQDEYIKQCSHGRPRAILDALLGPNPTPATRSRIKVTQESRWPSVFFRRLPTVVKGNAARHIADEMVSAPVVKDLVENVIRKRSRIPDGTPINPTEQLSLLGNYLTRYKHDLDMDAWRKAGSPPDQMPVMPTWKADTALDDFFAATSRADREKILGNIIGNQKIDAEEFIHRVLDAEVILDDITIATNYHGVQTLWDIPGFHKMLGNVVTRSGYEKGLVFEIEQIIKLKKAYPDAKIVLQVNIPPDSILSGPDIVLIRNVNGSEVAEIFQAKSVRDINSMTGYTGAMFEQTSSDIQRLYKHYGDHWIDSRPHIKLPDGKFVPLSNKWVFQGDYLMMREAEEVVAKLDSVIGPNQSFDPSHLKGQLQSRMDAVTTAWKNLSENTSPFSSLSDVERRNLLGTTGARASALHKYVANAGENITVREAFFAKMACDGAGKIEPELVTKLMNMQPPIEIKGDLIMTETDMFSFWRKAG